MTVLHKLSPAEARDHLAQSGTVLVDIRQRDEFARTLMHAPRNRARA